MPELAVEVVGDFTIQLLASIEEREVCWLRSSTVGGLPVNVVEGFKDSIVNTEAYLWWEDAEAAERREGMSGHCL